MNENKNLNKILVLSLNKRDIQRTVAYLYMGWVVSHRDLQVNHSKCFKQRKAITDILEWHHNAMFPNLENYDCFPNGIIKDKSKYFKIVPSHPPLQQNKECKVQST